MRALIPVVVGFCGTSLVGGEPSAARPPAVVVVIRPTIARLEQRSTIVVSGVPRSGRLVVRLAGSTTSIGLLAPWQPLRFRDGAWTGELLPLERRGVYPIQLRRQPNGRIMQSPRWLFRVLAPDTLRLPAFPSLFDVARWWVRAVAHGTVVAVRPWQFPMHDYRDPRLQRELVVAYSPRGDSTVAGRLGMFITCVRLDFGGNWRLLEASVRP